MHETTPAGTLQQLDTWTTRGAVDIATVQPSAELITPRDLDLPSYPPPSLTTTPRGSPWMREGNLRKTSVRFAIERPPSILLHTVCGHRPCSHPSSRDHGVHRGTSLASLDRAQVDQRADAGSDHRPLCRKSDLKPIVGDGRVGTEAYEVGQKFGRWRAWLKWGVRGTHTRRGQNFGGCGKVKTLKDASHVWRTRDHCWPLPCLPRDIVVGSSGIILSCGDYGSNASTNVACYRASFRCRRRMLARLLGVSTREDGRRTR